ncbi:MAG: hypothetical protein ABI579_02420 [Candidatus Sumerlaeota bacterium]
MKNSFEREREMELLGADDNEQATHVTSGLRRGIAPRASHRQEKNDPYFGKKMIERN